MPKAARPPRQSPDSGQPAAATPDVRALVVRLLLRVGQGGRMTPLLRAALTRAPWSDEQRAFATELAYGSLRHQAALDAALEVHLAQPVARLPPPVREALRLGAYQLLHLRTPAHAAVAQSVALVPKRYGRLRGLANAVLRKLASAPASPAPSAGRCLAPALADASSVPAAANGDGLLSFVSSTTLAVQSSQPAWFIDCLRERLGNGELLLALAANNERPPVMIRINACRVDRAQVVARLASAKVHAFAHPALPLALSLVAPGDVAKLPGHAEGWFTVQDGAAQLVGHVADVRPGMRVLDACAAPGGKTGHLLEAVGPNGCVVAADRHRARLARVQQTAERLGLAAALHCMALDLTDPEQVAEAVAYAGGPFDCVVLDAPCSGMGTLRRHPELRQRAAASIDDLLLLQRSLLRAVAPAVAPGGSLIYAVCSPLTAEGEAQAAAFVAGSPRFAVAALPAAMQPFADGHGVATWPHRHGLDAFYAARLRA